VIDEQGQRVSSISVNWKTGRLDVKTKGLTLGAIPSGELATLVNSFLDNVEQWPDYSDPENLHRLQLFPELIAALEACQHVEEVYEMWRTDDDEGFTNAQIVDGYDEDGVGHEYLEGLRDEAISLTHAALSLAKPPEPSGEKK